MYDELIDNLYQEAHEWAVSAEWCRRCGDEIGQRIAERRMRVRLSLARKLEERDA